jgi:hypothetical protein
MIKKFIKFLVLFSITSVISSTAGGLEIVADSDALPSFQTMSHGIGGN